MRPFKRKAFGYTSGCFLMTAGFSTPSFAVATTPTVVSTFFFHLLGRRKRKSASKKSLATGGPGVVPVRPAELRGRPPSRPQISRIRQSSWSRGASTSFYGDVGTHSALVSPSGCEDTWRDDRESGGHLGEAFVVVWAGRSEWGRLEIGGWGEMVEGQREEAGGRMDRGKSPGTVYISRYDHHQLWSSPSMGQAETPQMQKDYIRRQATGTHATDHAAISTDRSVTPNATSKTTSYRNHHIPKRAGTSGSVKDNSGAEVSGDRVILYIHGEVMSLRRD